MKPRIVSTPKKTIPDRTYKIGCFYFPGWGTPCGGPSDGGSSAAAWAYIPVGERPLKGAYNENLPEVCDAQLTEMRDFGLSFVVVDGYQRGGYPYLNHWIDNALASTVVNKPKICAMYAEPSSTPQTLEGFQSYMDTVSSYITNPDYFRIDGRPVVFILPADNFKTSVGGTTSSVLTALTNARNSTNYYFVGMGTNQTHLGHGPDSLKNAGYDAISYYNLPFGPPGTWAELERNYKSYFSRLAESTLPSILPVSTGFDDRNWGLPYRNTLETIEQFEAHLINVKAYLDYSYDKNNGMAVIEAWNEYGEGGVLEPAVHNGGTARGLKVKEIFGL